MSPTPAARAIADRLMFDTGNLKYLAAVLPSGALERTALAAGWTVRQMLAHLADAQDGYAEILEGLRKGVAPGPARFDPTLHNAGVAVRNQSTRLPVIIEQFDSSLCRLVAELMLVDEAASRLRIGLYELPDVLRAWSNHAAGHGMEMLDALPELRDDHMLLNWLLYEDFSEDPVHLESQQRLLQEIRDRYGSDDEEDEDE